MKVKRNVILASFAFLVFCLFSATSVQAAAPRCSEPSWFQLRLELRNQSPVRQVVIEVEKSPSVFENVRKNVVRVRSFRWSGSGWVRVQRNLNPEKVREETAIRRVFRWSDINWRSYRRVREDLKVSPPSIPIPDKLENAGDDSETNIDVPETSVDEPESNVDESEDSVDEPGVDASDLELDADEPEVDVDELEASADELIILELTNRERVARGLPALIFDSELSRVARIKSQDMIDKNYFSHTSPTYGSPFEMMRHFGIKYSYAGENIARAFSPQSAVALFMQSSGHRASILNTRFDSIGIGVVKANGSYFVTQMFIGQR